MTEMRNIHKAEQFTKNRTFHIKCSFCNFGLNCHSDLRDHLITDHQVEIFKEERNFKNKEAFISWKTEKEKAMKCTYVKNSGTRKLKTATKTYYYCHRSLNGHHVTETLDGKETRKRKLKKQGYTKLNISCPSTLEFCEKDGKLSGTLFFPHIGHDCSLAHINISPQEKAQIAGKIANGVSFDHILNEIRNSSSESLGRIHLLNRQDLRNIRKQYGLENIIQLDDTISLAPKPESTEEIKPNNIDLACLLNDAAHHNNNMTKLISNSERMKEKLNEIMGLISTHSFPDEIHIKCEKLLDSIIGTYKIYQDKLPKPSIKEPANKNANKQLRFASTKRKNTSTAQCLIKKPCFEEKEKIDLASKNDHDYL